MKDLYKRLGIDPSASASRIREAISSPVANADAATLKAAEFVLLDGKRRTAYDRTHGVLSTIGDLRAHLGLNYKTFWARGKLRDFTYELAGPQSRRPRRTIRSLRPSDIRRAFALRGSDPAGEHGVGKRRLLPVAVVLLAVTLVAVAVLIYFAFSR